MLKGFVIFTLALSFLNCSTTSSAKPGMSLGKTVETEHFIFHFEEEQEDLTEVFEVLEQNYDRICGKWDVQFTEKSPVFIYPDIVSYHNAINRPEDPSWSAGICTMDGRLLFTSPNNPGEAHDYNGIMEIAVHEFTHLVISRINYNIPMWLNEGIAVYEAQQLTPGGRQMIKQHQANGSIPSFFEMEYLWMDAAETKAAYDFSYTIVEFMEQEYGTTKLRRLVERPLAYKEILGVKKKQLYKEWLRYLEEHYS